MNSLKRAGNPSAAEYHARHILVVDDDRNMREMLIDNLSAHHFRVSATTNGSEAKQVASRGGVALAIVDLNLGREDGLNVVRDLSSKSIPVIIITGNRIDEADKVVGLEIGAVDYLTKPFGMSELLARVRSKLRRRAETKKDLHGKGYMFAEFRMDTKARKLFHGDTEINLSAAEFNLLTVFLAKPNQILTREQLMLESRVRGDGIFDRSVDVLILRLRRKLEPQPAWPTFIKTVRNAGYIFDGSVAEMSETIST
ncbi:response regulator [Rhizobium leguminosarum]|uniref:response regulator n=1 Tax=Rhizobium leguminosarum TaxID=384 RepID=UPI001C979EAC|nr:response regulator [Rhizobium leguminosarum]MBY5538274.1 response regulator [Rhizobium leguminosarum]